MGRYPHNLHGELLELCRVSSLAEVIATEILLLDYPRCNFFTDCSNTEFFQIV